MNNNTRIVAILLIVATIFITGTVYVMVKVPQSDKHLYGSTCIDTTCWNKNDQLHYILQETRLELKQCNFLTQELADSITKLHQVYGVNTTPIIHETNEYDKYNINVCSAKSRIINNDTKYSTTIIKQAPEMELGTIHKMPYTMENTDYEEAAKHVSTAHTDNPVIDFKIPAYPNSTIKYHITVKLD